MYEKCVIEVETVRHQSDSAEMSWVRSVLGPKCLDTSQPMWYLTVSICYQELGSEWGLGSNFEVRVGWIYRKCAISANRAQQQQIYPSIGGSREIIAFSDMIRRRCGYCLNVKVENQHRITLYHIATHTSKNQHYYTVLMSTQLVAMTTENHKSVKCGMWHAQRATADFAERALL